MTTAINTLTTFIPTHLSITGVNLLADEFNKTNLLVYGEIHGIRENADIIYTLAHDLGVRRLAIEVSPSVRAFIDKASDGVYDFSLINTDIFDLSILSPEVIKSIVTLKREGYIHEIVYIDTDVIAMIENDHPDSPQQREKILARNILSLDNTKTLCIMGQWHTLPDPVVLPDTSITHYSALWRIREIKPTTPFVHLIYHKGQAYNDGHVLKLPTLPMEDVSYTLKQVAMVDYELHVPEAHPIKP